MIKELKIGKKIFMAQTTYYIYRSEEELKKGRAFLTTSNKDTFEGYLKQALGYSIKNIMSKLKERRNEE